MKKLILGLCIALAPLVAHSSEHIEVTAPFARASIPGMSMGAAFMQLDNHGKEERLLVEARSDVAKHVEIHNHVKVDGMMRMRQMAHIHVKPGQTKTLQPGGLHIMFMGLHQPLKQGESFDLTLIFDDGSSKTVAIPIKAIGATK